MVDISEINDSQMVSEPDESMFQKAMLMSMDK